MPQGRILLKSISESKKLSQLKTDGARLLYTWLISHVNVNGCFSADPEIINGQIFTRLKKSIENIKDFLNDIESIGLIKRYESNNDIYLYIPDFVDKQPSLNPSKEGKVNIPMPTPDQLQTNSRLTPTEVKESKVKESKDISGGPNPDHLKAIFKNLDSIDLKQLKQEFKQYREMRKKIRKPLTDHAEDLIINKLFEISGGDKQDAILIIQQSVMNSWQGLFPLKNIDGKEKPKYKKIIMKRTE